MDSCASAPVFGGNSPADGRIDPTDTAPGGPPRRTRLGAGRLRRKALLGAGLLLAALVASCAVPRLAPPDPSHPASPDAAESTVAEPAAFLGPGGVIGGEREPALEMQHGPEMMHGGGGTMQHGAGGAGHGH